MLEMPGGECGEENVFTLEEWRELMQEVSLADRRRLLQAEEDEPAFASDFDCLPSEC